MNRKLYLASAVFFMASHSLEVAAQSPGGVSSGLRVWLKPETGFTPGSWTDQSGNGNHFTQSNAGRQPIPVAAKDSFNYNPFVDFGTLTTNARFMVVPAGRPYTADGLSSTVFLSSINRNTSSYSDMLGFGATTTAAALADADNAVVTILNGNLMFYPATVSALAVKAGQMTINDGAYTAGSGGTKYGVNGVSGSVAYNLLAANNKGASGAILGAQLGEETNGYIGEVICYERELSVAEKAKVRSYLAIKYGVSLPHYYVASNGTTVYWDTVVNNGYRNNIAGIGLDNNTTLNQKQSKSVNGPDNVLIGNGTSLASTNAANPNSFAADLSFLVWGDNGNAKIFRTSLSGFAGISSRLGAIWKVQETGTVGMVSVAWPVPTADPFMKLIVSNDGIIDGTGETTYATTTTTVNGQLYQMATVDFTSGQYFTFGTVNAAPGGVSTGLTFWGAADNTGATPGSTMASWKNLSSWGKYGDLDVVGTKTLQAGDAAHNFNPWTSSFSFENYFKRKNDSLFLDYDVVSYRYTPLKIFSVARATSSAEGTITGIDNNDNLAAEPRLAVGKTGSNLFPASYRYSNATWNVIASGSAMQVALNKSSLYMLQPPYSGTGSDAGTGTGTLTLGLDGTTLGISGVSATGSTAGAYMNIGYDGWSTGHGGASAFPGDIQDVIWYRAALSTTDESKINSYLAIKNGITLTTGVATNYVSPAGVNVWTGDVSYQYNIAGIGRDDIERLNQKQSNSVNANTNGQIVIGLSTIAATNQLNATAFAKDSTYMIWGDNNNTQSLTTASTVFTYNGYTNNKRMNRIWKVQNSGTNAMLQAVKIQFPTASVGTTTLTGEGSCAQYVFITSTDPTFTTGVTSSVLVTNGSNYELSRKFPAGITYFTFAKVNETPPGTVYLPTTDIAFNTTDLCLKATGWKYYYYDAAKTQRAFAINWNGNTEPSGVNGVLTYSASPYAQATGGSATNIMGRLLEILPAGGNYTVNNGVKVRVFFDSTELNNSLVSNYLSAKWFKYPGSAIATQAANNGQSITGATFLTPAAASEEDGVDYVEFNNIKSFSTFGFASNSGAVPLPVTLINFNGVAIGSHAHLMWYAANEIKLNRYEVEYSGDGKTFRKVGAVTPKGNSANDYEFDYDNLQSSNNYFRLKMVDINGNFTYSTTVNLKQAANEAEAEISIYPNPASGDAILIGSVAGDELILMSIDGRIISHQIASGVQSIIRLDAVPAGAYQVVLSRSGRKITARKLMKQ
jgi:hypothetical protein